MRFISNDKNLTHQMMKKVHDYLVFNNLYPLGFTLGIHYSWAIYEKHTQFLKSQPTHYKDPNHNIGGYSEFGVIEKVKWGLIHNFSSNNDSKAPEYYLEKLSEESGVTRGPYSGTIQNILRHFIPDSVNFNVKVGLSMNNFDTLFPNQFVPNEQESGMHFDYFSDQDCSTIVGYYRTPSL